MRLIDVDELKADYRMADDCKDYKTGYRSCEYNHSYSKMNFCGWLDDAPPVDAVLVVRCKDCRWHGYNTYTKVHYCRRPNVVLVIKEDDFCSRGERKDSSNVRDN